jgi:HPt (histidine-containing phosphotransfer) domain-containing protein
VLIYNSRKEFQGIDEKDLSALGCKTLSELRAESADFADLFVRTPGFIHNFKYVHWIDYITYGGSSTTPKAIIHIKDKNYWCNISITTAYLVDDSASKAYLVNLENLRELSKQESLAMTNDILAKPVPRAVKERPAPYVDPSIDENIRVSIAKQNSMLNSSHIEDEETLVQEVKPVQQPVKESKKVEKKSTVSSVAPVSTNVKQEVTKDKKLDDEVPVEVTEVTSQDDNSAGYNKDYVYDPQVASDELGLPVDLIEEFIEDFIAQAKEFKDDLFTALNDEDINNVRILSHKLKGVAANLRIENAFEVLTTINTSDDLKEIRENLGYLYIIISTLNGEEVDELDHLSIQEEEEDDFILDFKEIDDKEDDSISQEDKKQPSDDSQDDDLMLSLQIEDDETTDNLVISYDKVAAAQKMGLTLDLFDELFNDYLNDSKELCSSIKDAISSFDFEKCNDEAIKLKGMSNNMKVDLFTNELEILLKTSDPTSATEAIDKIISIISNLEA